MFLYTNNEPSKKGIKETTPFIMALKGIKDVGINLTKEVKSLYIKNYKTLLKEIEDVTGETAPVQELEHLILRCRHFIQSNGQSH